MSSSIIYSLMTPHKNLHLRTSFPSQDLYLSVLSYLYFHDSRASQVQYIQDSVLPDKLLLCSLSKNGTSISEAAEAESWMIINP